MPRSGHDASQLVAASVIVALLTPFSADERVDLAAVRDHVEFLVGAGVDGIMPAGTTGEGPLLSDDEIEGLVAAVVEAAGGRVSVLAHVGRPGTQATVDLARRALAAGADSVSAVVPYYYAFDDEALVSHYRALLSALPDTPVYAYTIPIRAQNELGADAVRLLAGEGLAGVKDSTKSFDRHLEYLQATESTTCAVLMGSDGLVIEALRAGATGAVSALANLRPDLLVRLKLAYLSGDDRRAQDAQQDILDLRTELAGGRALVRLKRAVAERLRERGSSFSAGLRAPLD